MNDLYCKKPCFQFSQAPSQICLHSAVPGLLGSSQSKRMACLYSSFLLPAEHAQLWACTEASHNLAVS